jgi:hypothetical protein
MKKGGPKCFVCRQYLATEKIAAQSLTPGIILAADALLVLIDYQNQGYAALSFWDRTTEASLHSWEFRDFSSTRLALAGVEILTDSVGRQGCLRVP